MILNPPAPLPHHLGLIRWSRLGKLWSPQLKNDPVYNIVAVFWRETYWVGQTAITNGHRWVRVLQLITQVAGAVDRFLKFWA